MALILRQSTEVTEMVGPFLDATNGKDEEEGEASTATRISKNGAAYAAGPVLGTHDEDGWYPITLTTSHTDTVGRLKLKCQDPTTFLPVWVEYQVIETAIYDALFADSATGLLPANVTQWLGSAAATPTVAGVPEVDLTHVMGTILTEGGAGRLAAALIKLLDVATPELVASDVMRGTDSAALASVLGALADAAAAGDPTSSDTVMQYAKQLINVLVGTAGVTTFPAAAAPANAVSLAEVLRAVYDDSNDLQANQGAWATATGFATSAALSTHDGKLDTAQADLDTITGADGVTLATTQGLYAPAKAGDNMGLSAWAVTAAVVATDAIDADALAADAVTEIVAGLLGGEITELASVPAASPTLEQALALLFMALRNKVTATASVLTIHNDAGSALGTKGLSDDDTTYTEAELS